MLPLPRARLPLSVISLVLNPTSSLRPAIAYSQPNHRQAGKTLCHRPPTWSFLIPTHGPGSSSTPALLAPSLPTLDRISAYLGLLLSKCPADALSTLLWPHGLNHQAPLPSVPCCLWSMGDLGRRAGGRAARERSGYSLPLGSHFVSLVAPCARCSLFISPVHVTASSPHPQALGSKASPLLAAVVLHLPLHSL